MASGVLALLVIPLISAVQKLGIDAAKWNYNSSHDTGPHSWHQLDSSWTHCSKMSQSPISIGGSQKVIKCPWMEEVRFQGYEVPISSADLINNGHTIQLDISANPTSPSIFGSGLPQYYDLVQMHLHWGESDKVGSEHAFGTQFYPCELHFVHTKRQYHRDVKRALGDPMGLAVLGVLCEISQFENQAFQDTIIDKLQAIKYSGQKTRVYEVRLNKLLPELKHNFFRYSGSLTTPSCNEAVVWTVFVDTIKISSSQVAQLRNLFHTPHDSTDKMLLNYRPLQPLNDRLIFYRSDLPEPIENLVSMGSANVTFSMSTVIGFVLLWIVARVI